MQIQITREIATKNKSLTFEVIFNRSSIAKHDWKLKSKEVLQPENIGFGDQSEDGQLK